MGRTAEVIAFATAVAAATCAATQAAVLPDGTYRYAVRSDGKQTATTTVTISHDASSVTVKETTGLDAEKLTTTRLLDPQTFSTRSWSVDDPPTTIAITAKSATYGDGKKTTTLAAPAEGPSAVFDFFVAEFVTLPAMIHATERAALQRILRLLRRLPEQGGRNRARRRAASGRSLAGRRGDGSARRREDRYPVVRSADLHHARARFSAGANLVHSLVASSFGPRRSYLLRVMPKGSLTSTVIVAPPPAG